MQSADAMSGAARSWHPDDSHVLHAWLSGIVNVYEPWTRSEIVPAKERALALRRIKRSRVQMAEIDTLRADGSR
ncbi:hypothetical protein GCM10027589_05370 [Actinocorallia lasiicapitis]